MKRIALETRGEKECVPREELVDKLIKLAIDRHAKESQLKTTVE